MKIIKHHFLEGTLQRSEIRHDGKDYIRIARWVQSSGILMPLERGVVPTWRLANQEEGCFLNPDEGKELERCFVTTLIRQNVDSGAIAPAYRTLEDGEVIEEGDSWSPDAGNNWIRTVFAKERRVKPGEIYRRAVVSRSPEAAE